MGAVASRHARGRVPRLAVAVFCLVALVPSAAEAQTLGERVSPVEISECFQTVLTDAVLAHDLVCETGGFEWGAITIGASNVTLDLGGHTVFGYFIPAGIGVKVEHVEGVTIKNGTIDGFRCAIDLFRTRDVLVEQVTIRNLDDDDPGEFLPGLRVVESHNAVARDCRFEFLPVEHKEAVVFSNGQATFDAIEVYGGSVGVNYGGTQDFEGGSRGSVINSRFLGAVIGAVLLQNTDDALIADNEMRHTGVLADAAAYQGVISGVTLEGNTIGDAYIGVHFMGVTDSSIVDNVIHDSRYAGVWLDGNMGCPEDAHMPWCFYSTGIEVAGNEVLGRYIDLYQHPYAVGNSWERNTCRRKQGSEIPPCPRLRHRVQSVSP